MILVGYKFRLGQVRLANIIFYVPIDKIGWLKIFLIQKCNNTFTDTSFLSSSESVKRSLILGNAEICIVDCRVFYNTFRVNWTKQKYDFYINLYTPFYNFRGYILKNFLLIGVPIKNVISVRFSSFQFHCGGVKSISQLMRLFIFIPTHGVRSC